MTPEKDLEAVVHEFRKSVLGTQMKNPDCARGNCRAVSVALMGLIEERGIEPVELINQGKGNHYVVLVRDVVSPPPDSHQRDVALDPTNTQHGESVPVKWEDGETYTSDQRFDVAIEHPDDLPSWRETSKGIGEWANPLNVTSSG